MTPEILLVFVILAVTIALFVSDRLRLDLVALLSLLALTLTGIITPREALAGFSDSVVVMLAGLFVVSAGLFQTGVADRIGKALERLAGKSEVRLIALVMLTTATLSAFMSSTGTVAVMLPVVVSLAWSARLSPSKLLIPLSFASLLGGMLTLIGTPPNLVASNQAVAAGLPPFSFFAFTPVGLGMLAIGLAFMLLVGRHLLPSRAPAAAEEAARSVISSAELVDIYQLRGSLFRVQVPPASPLVGRTLAQAALRQHYGITVLAKQRTNGNHAPRTEIAEPTTLLEAGDTLFIRGYEAKVAEFIEAEGLVMLPVSLGDDELLPSNLLFAEVLLTPRSSLIGKTLRDVRFYELYGITVVAIKRLGEVLAADTASTPLRFGDTLLVEGVSKNLDVLKGENRDFVVVAEPLDTGSKRRAAKRAPLAIAITLGMLLLMTLDVVSTVIAALLAAVAMVLTRCLSMEDAYRGINWESLVLIAGILPMATALDKTGGLQLIVAGLGNLAVSPLLMLGALFLITSTFSQVISNTATAVLMSPIALQLALALGISPYPFLMAVAIAASTAFTTPIASPVNTLVLGPGRYRFGDFFRVGISLQLLLLLAALLIIPQLFPF